MNIVTTTIYAALAATLFLTSCSRQSDAVKFKTFKAEKAVVMTGETDPDYGQGLGYEINFTYPVKYTDPTVLKKLQKQITGIMFGEEHADLAPQKAIEAYIADMEEMYNAEMEYLQNTNNNPDFTMGWLVKCSNSTLFMNETLLQIKKERGHYPYGGHVFEWLSYHLFDLQTGDKLSRDDVFKPETFESLRRQLIPEIIKTINVEPDMLADIQRDMYRTWEPMFALTNDGFLFSYEDEFGYPTCTIPHARILPYLIEGTPMWKTVREMAGELLPEDVPMDTPQQKADIDLLLSWFEMSPAEFGCMMEQTYGHRNERFNCSLTDYENNGGPCFNDEEYYEGPEFPEELVKQVHPWLKRITLEWEGGRIRLAWFHFDNEPSDEAIIAEFGIDLKKYEDYFYPQIEPNHGSLIIVGFMHTGAGDLDCDEMEKYFESVMKSAYPLESHSHLHYYVDEYGKIGVINTKNKMMKIYPWYDELEDYIGHPDLLLARQDGKAGIIDIKCNTVIPFGYDTIRWTASYAEDGFPCCIDGKWGLVAPGDKIIIPLAYDDVNGFKNGLASVRRNGKWGFVDKNNKLVVPFTYDEVEIDHFGAIAAGEAAIVSRDGKRFWIDGNGKENLIND